MPRHRASFPSSMYRYLCFVFPIFEWLPAYQWKFNFSSDVVAGITVAVMQVPQGIAYGILASVDPVSGLYTAIFPVIIYILLGTSRHASFGTFAVVSIMTSKAVHSFSNISADNTQSLSIHHDSTPIEIATSLTLFCGLIQLTFGLLQIGPILTSIMSDSLITGLTTGAAFHVLSSQVEYMLGISENGTLSSNDQGSMMAVSDTLLQSSSNSSSSVLSLEGSFIKFKLYERYSRIISNLQYINYYTLSISVSFIIILNIYEFCLKSHINKLMYRGIPFPIQLFAVMISGLLSYLLNLNDAPYHVRTVGFIPRGLPYPSFPPLFAHKLAAAENVTTTVTNTSTFTNILALDLVVPAFTVSLISYTISYSVATVMARRGGYKIHPSREFVAMGCANIFGSAFSCIPVSASLSRSSVQENVGGRTLLTSVVCVLVVLIVVLSAGPLLSPIPNAVLSAIIVVSLNGLIGQIFTLPPLFKQSKFDGFVFLLTFLIAIIVDVDAGLATGVSMNVLTLLYKTILSTNVSSREEIVVKTTFDLSDPKEIRFDVSNHCPPVESHDSVANNAFGNENGDGKLIAFQNHALDAENPQVKWSERRDPRESTKTVTSVYKNRRDQNISLVVITVKGDVHFANAESISESILSEFESHFAAQQLQKASGKKMKKGNTATVEIDGNDSRRKDQNGSHSQRSNNFIYDTHAKLLFCLDLSCTSRIDLSGVRMVVRTVTVLNQALHEHCSNSDGKDERVEAGLYLILLEHSICDSRKNSKKKRKSTLFEQCKLFDVIDESNVFTSLEDLTRSISQDGSECFLKIPRHVSV